MYPIGSYWLKKFLEPYISIFNIYKIIYSITTNFKTDTESNELMNNYENMSTSGVASAKIGGGTIFICVHRP